MEMLRISWQRLLSPLAVVNPFAPALTFATARTRNRRDHEKYLTLIDAIALLHQHQRQCGQHLVNGRVAAKTLGYLFEAAPHPFLIRVFSKRPRYVGISGLSSAEKIVQRKRVPDCRVSLRSQALAVENWGIRCEDGCKTMVEQALKCGAQKGVGLAFYCAVW